MKIGIEGQRIFRNKKHGMDMVALELIRNLQEIDHENEYVIFVRPDEDASVLSETGNFKIVKLGGGLYPFWEQVSLPRAARRAGCDLLHCTSNTAPVNTKLPLVVTLHDIIYMEKGYAGILGSGGSLYQKLGNVYRRFVVPGIIRKSRKVITVSRFEKDRIGEYFGMRGSSRLAAVYNGVSEHFRPVKDPVEINRIRMKYRLPGRYFFFLGNTDPKKNTKGVLKAYSDFVKIKGNDIKMVMPDFDRVELEKMLSAIGDPALMDQIHLTGYVVNKDLPAIYSLSEAFLYPSLRESFGIPILEAMACGTPVITGNTSSMPEVAGDAAMTVDPHAPGEITAAMLLLLDDDRLKESLVNRGFEQAARFSWKAMAHSVLDIYREVMSEKESRTKS